MDYESSFSYLESSFKTVNYFLLFDLIHFLGNYIANPIVSILKSPFLTL